jgi:RHS repeat-associated protein
MGNRRGWDYLATKGWQNFTRKDNGLNQYRMWSPYSIINYDDDIGNGWGSPGAANGVLMQDGWVTAGYNALNQPMYIWSGNVGWTYFGYDGLGRCVKRWADNGSVAYMYYDGWNLIQDGPQSSIADRVYVHGARTDEVVAQITPANNWIRYFHYDANGNCTLQTDGWGNLVEQYDYDAFGFPYFYDASGNNIGYSPWGNRMLFTGREWLSDLKLYDYRNRMYQPELGRFMQPDPKEFAAGDYNLYRYCHNDPVNHSDPTGLMSLTGWGGGDWKWFNGGVALAQLNAISLQKMAAAMRFVPTNFAKDHKTVLPSSTDHAGGIYEYQYSNSAGQRQSGVGVTVLEKVQTVAGDEVGQVQKQKAPLQSNGIFRDHVGSNRRPSHADDGHYSISHQTFQIERNGETVPVSTKLGHDVRFINGEVVPRVWVIEP